MWPPAQDISAKMLDITGPKEVEIRIDHTRHVVWININGAVCALRACNIETIKLVEIEGGK